MKTKEEAQQRALYLFPFPDVKFGNVLMERQRQAYLQCFEDMQSELVSFGNFLLADRGEGNYLMSNKCVTHADFENWKNERK